MLVAKHNAVQISMPPRATSSVEPGNEINRSNMETANYQDDDTQTISATELDSHADLPVVGKYCRILEDTGRKARVSGFTSELGKPLVVKVVNAAVAYDCEHTGMTHILVI